MPQGHATLRHLSDRTPCPEHFPLRAVFLLLSLLMPAIFTPLRMLADDQATTSSLLDMSIEDLMKVDVNSVYGASRYKQRVAETPASVTVITADEIRRYGYRTLADILASVPGFYVTYDRGYSYLGVRGFGPPGDYNSRILIMVDGHE